MALPALITSEASTASAWRASRRSARYAQAATASVRLQGCNWFKCAGLAVTCAASCLSGVGTAACIACLGGAWGECKDCF